MGRCTTRKGICLLNLLLVAEFLIFAHSFWLEPQWNSVLQVVYAVANEGSRLELPEGPLGRLIAGTLKLQLPLLSIIEISFIGLVVTWSHVTYSEL